MIWGVGGLVTQGGRRLVGGAGRIVQALAGDAGRSWNGRRAALLAALLLLALLALNLYAPAGPGLSLRLLAGLLLLLCAAPSLWWAAGSGRADSRSNSSGRANSGRANSGRAGSRPAGAIPGSNGSILPVCGLAYGLYFASPVFLRADFTLPWRPDAAVAAGQIEFVLLLALGGWTLLLAGYWLLGQDWAARRLPRINLLSGPAAHLLSGRWASTPAASGNPPSASPPPGGPTSTPAAPDNPRLDLALAVVIGVVSVPFLYLDKAAVAAFYTGETLLPSAVAFPVHFLGQLSLLSILLLFFRQLRGGLPWPGRLFMGALAAAYTLLGLSTGLALQGLTAVFGLFVACAVAGRLPSWRWALGGAALLLAAVFLLLPSRPEFRVLTWTRGIAPDAYVLGRVQPYILIPPSSAAPPPELLERYGLAAPARYEIVALPPSRTPETPVIDHPPYRIYWQDDTLSYSHRDAAVCHLPPGAEGAPVFFVHIFAAASPSGGGARSPAAAGGGAPAYASLEFPLAESGTVVAGRCEVRAPLPDYPIAFLRAGQYFAGVNWPIALAEQTALTGRVGNGLPAARRELGAHVSASVTQVDQAGEWQLRTRARGDWRIDPFFTGASRLLLHEAAAGRRAQLLRAQPGHTVIVQLNEQIWGEYLISRVVENGNQVAFWLAALIDYRGELPAAPGGGGALLYHPTGPEPPPPATATATETADDNGGGTEAAPPPAGPRLNPAAPGADASQLDKAALYLRTLWQFALSRPYTLESLRQSLDAAAQRLDLLLPVAWAAAQTPEQQPWLQGETYYPLLFKPVPRFLYPDKPTEVADLGQRYGLIAAENETNRYNLHQLGELYLNFGIAGALAGMFLLGAALRVIYGMFCRPHAPLLTLAAGAHLLTVLLAGMESLASASWGFVLWYAVFLALLAAAQAAVNFRLRMKN